MKNKKLTCNHCGSDQYKKNGKDKGVQIYLCKKCNKEFRESYSNGLMLENSTSKNDIGIESKMNFMDVNIKTNYLNTVEKLLETHGVDLNIWRIEKKTINKTDKIIKEGSDISLVPTIELKVSLSKIVPDIQKFPVINTLKINSVKQNITKLPNNKDFKKAIIFPDSQVGFMKNIENGVLDPFHDRRCLDIALKATQEVKPDVIVLLGDMIDFPEQSDKFIKKPEFYFTTQSSLIELGWWISQLRLLNPNAEIVYLKGNHEVRCENSIINNMIWAYGLKPFNKMQGDPALSIENLLSLKELNVNFIKDYPNGEYWLNDNLKIIHGTVVKQGSGETSKELLKNARSSVIQGHIHRMETASKTVHSKDKIISYTAASFGCMCRIDGIVPAFSGQQNWQQGFGIIDFQPNNGPFQMYSHYINDGSTIVNGKIIKSDEKSYLTNLKKDTNWKF